MKPPTIGVYERFVLPRLLALAMRHRELVPFRRRVGRATSGRVPELGVGSGLNLDAYNYAKRLKTLKGITP